MSEITTLRHSRDDHLRMYIKRYMHLYIYTHFDMWLVQDCLYKSFERKFAAGLWLWALFITSQSKRMWHSYFAIPSHEVIILHINKLDTWKYTRTWCAPVDKCVHIKLLVYMQKDMYILTLVYVWWSSSHNFRRQQLRCYDEKLVSL